MKHSTSTSKDRNIFWIHTVQQDTKLFEFAYTIRDSQQEELFKLYANEHIRRIYRLRGPYC